MPMIMPSSELRSNCEKQTDVNKLCCLIDEGLEAAAAGRTRPYDEAIEKLQEELRNGKL
ncbi:MAG: hypothetical protein FWD25_04430 [Clostridia bacterium]|nr:hypothetical protein [Clostridia bacterium]